MNDAVTPQVDYAIDDVYVPYRSKCLYLDVAMCV